MGEPVDPCCGLMGLVAASRMSSNLIASSALSLWAFGAAYGLHHRGGYG